MTIQVTGIEAVADAASYRLLLDVDGTHNLYIVDVQRDPFFAVSSPHSFWMMCAEHEIVAHDLLDLVRRIDAAELLTWPATTGAPSKSQSRERELWAANH